MVWLWIGFLLFVVSLLAVDLGVFHRAAHVVRIREALTWSGVWITLALAFAVFVYFGYEHHWLGLGTTIDAVDGQFNDGRAAATKYLTGYVIEKSLSVDNIFVIAMIFSALAVPAMYQHRVLFWGILGALAMRGAMIFVGAELIAHYHWALYVFGGFLVVMAGKMLLTRHDPGQKDPHDNLVVRTLRRFVRVSDAFDGSHFVTRMPARDADYVSGSEPLSKSNVLVSEPATVRRSRGALALTPLSVALVVVEATDLLFAVDSIPAIFAVTADAFLVFTSNVFAMLGLRSLYFALAGMIDKFRYLKHALAAILAAVGMKMLASHWLQSWLGAAINFYFLAFVLLVLGIGLIASLLADGRGFTAETQRAQSRG